MISSRPAGYDLSGDPHRLQPAAIHAALARVVTDHAAFAHPDLQSLRRWTLNTRDAHSLYERHGWERVTDIFMQRYDADASRRGPA